MMLKLKSHDMARQETDCLTNLAFVNMSKTLSAPKNQNVVRQLQLQLICSQQNLTLRNIR